MKCKPCSISFPSSVDLIHHVFNDHNFQPTIELDHVESVDEVLTKYINTTQKKKRNRIPAKPKGKRFLRIKRDLTKMWKSEKKVPIVLKLLDIGPLFFFFIENFWKIVVFVDHFYVIFVLSDISK